MAHHAYHSQSLDNDAYATAYPSQTRAPEKLVLSLSAIAIGLIGNLMTAAGISRGLVYSMGETWILFNWVFDIIAISFSHRVPPGIGISVYQVTCLGYN